MRRIHRLFGTGTCLLSLALWQCGGLEQDIPSQPDTVADTGVSGDVQPTDTGIRQDTDSPPADTHQLQDTSPPQDTTPPEDVPPPPLKLTAGAAERVVTPQSFETYEDLNGNYHFDGQLDNPAGNPQAGIEPFDDANGNGEFDAIWLGGQRSSRPANSVHDDLYATALVFSDGRRVVAILGVDSIGIFIENRDQVWDRLKERGVPLDLFIVASAHNHEGPDSMGLWGYDELTTGINTDYMDFLMEQMAAAVEEAYNSMTDATLTLATTKTPLEVDNALQYDRRDPNIIDNDVALLRFDQADGSGAIATVVNWASHPEFFSGENWITADWVGVLRDEMKSRYPGSQCVFMNGALGGQIGSTDAQFTYDGVTYEKNDESWEKLTAVGKYVAQIAYDALENDGRPQQDFEITAAKSHQILLLAENIGFQLAFATDLFVYKKVYNADGTPFEGIPVPGSEIYAKSEAVYLKLGEMELLTAPGEVHPELVIGCYDGSCGNPNYPFLSDDNPNPSDIENAPEGPYWKDYLTAEVKFFCGLCNDQFGYIIPPFNFALHPEQPWMERWTRHHYEETNSIGSQAADVLDEAYRALTNQP